MGALLSSEQSALDSFILQDIDAQRETLRAAELNPKVSGPLMLAYRAALADSEYVEIRDNVLNWGQA